MNVHLVSWLFLRPEKCLKSRFCRSFIQFGNSLHVVVLKSMYIMFVLSFSESHKKRKNKMKNGEICVTQVPRVWLNPINNDNLNYRVRIFNNRGKSSKQKLFERFADVILRSKSFLKTVRVYSIIINSIVCICYRYTYAITIRLIYKSLNFKNVKTTENKVSVK